MAAAVEAEIRKTFPAAKESAAFSLDVCFEARDGVTALFGPSGAGKSLTLRAIAGFTRPDRGRIVVDGQTLFDGSRGLDTPARKRRVGYLFQQQALFPHMSVRGNLEFAADGLPRGSRARVDELLERFRIASVAGRRPAEISGGERQRCAIARALIGRPRLLLLDEPAQGLDRGLRREFHDVLRDLRSTHRIPMLLVTHDLAEAFALADDLFVYQDGRIIQQGPPRQVYERPMSAEAARLLGIPCVLEGRLLEADISGRPGSIETSGLVLAAPFEGAGGPGDQVGFCIRPEAVRAAPRNGALAPRQTGVRLRRAVEAADHVLLEFEGGLAATVAPEAWAAARGAREWALEFPAGALWVFSRR